MARTATIALGTSKENSCKVTMTLDHCWTMKNNETITKAVIAILKRVELTCNARAALFNKVQNIALFEMEENIRYNVSSAEKKLTLKECDETVKVLLSFS